MKTTTNVLFVGGPRDGEWWVVADGMRHVTVPVIDMQPIWPCTGSDSHNVGIKYVEYRREWLRADDGRMHSVFYCGEPGRLIETLINGYRKA